MRPRAVDPFDDGDKTTAGADPDDLDVTAAREGADIVRPSEIGEREQVSSDLASDGADDADDDDENDGTND